MRHLIAICLFLLGAGTPAYAQLLPPREPLPVTEAEAKNAIEAVLGIRPETIDMSAVRKFKARESDHVIEIDLEAEPFLSKSNVCRKRVARIVRPSWLTGAELKNDPAWFRVKRYGAEAPPQLQNCGTVASWILMSPNIEYPDGAIQFLPQLRDWMTGVSKEAFCAALADKQNQCDSAFRAIQRHSDLKRLNYMELYRGSPRGDEYGALGLHFQDDEYSTFVLTLHGTEGGDPFGKISITWIMV